MSVRVRAERKMPGEEARGVPVFELLSTGCAESEAPPPDAPPCCDCSSAETGQVFFAVVGFFVYFIVSIGTPWEIQVTHKKESQLQQSRATLPTN